jgi:hypothetical protein
MLTWSHQVSVNPYEDHDVWLDSDLLLPLGVQAATLEASQAFVRPGGVYTYTATLAGSELLVSSFAFTDTIPVETTYQPGSLWASGGSYGYNPSGEAITWTASIPAGGALELHFAVQADASLPHGSQITDTAALLDNLGIAFSPAATVTVDAQPPVSALLDPLDGQVISDTSYLLSGNAADPLSGVAGVSVSVDAGPWQPAAGLESWSYNWQAYADGQHNLRTQAMDAAGNLETPSAGVTVTVDTTPPSSTLLDPVAGQIITTSTYLLSGAASDNLTGVAAFSVSIDGGPWEAAAPGAGWSYEWSIAADGLHNLRTQAADAAGNFETPSEGITVTVDTAPPVSALLDPLDGQVISSTSYTLSGSASDTLSGLAGVSVSVDGGAWQPAAGLESWTFTWQGYADGAHTLRTQASDVAGHVETPSAGLTVSVDTATPELAAFTPLSGSLDVSLDAALVLTFSEPVQPSTLAFTVTPDPGGWSAQWDEQGMVVTLTHAAFLPGQTYTVQVLQARDLAGNPLDLPPAWAFTTLAPLPPGYQVFLPLALKK